MGFFRQEYWSRLPFPPPGIPWLRDWTHVSYASCIGRQVLKNQCRRHKRYGFSPWVEKIPWRQKWQPTPVFLPGESHGKGPMWAMVHGVAKSQTWLKWHSVSACTCTHTHTHMHAQPTHRIQQGHKVSRDKIQLFCPQVHYLRLDISLAGKNCISRAHQDFLQLPYTWSEEIIPGFSRIGSYCRMWIPKFLCCNITFMQCD